MVMVDELRVWPTKIRCFKAGSWVNAPGRADCPRCSVARYSKLFGEFERLERRIAALKGALTKARRRAKR